MFSMKASSINSLGKFEMDRRGFRLQASGLTFSRKEGLFERKTSFSIKRKPQSFLSTFYGHIDNQSQTQYLQSNL